MKNGQFGTLTQLAVELERQLGTKSDAVLNTSDMQLRTEEPGKSQLVTPTGSSIVSPLAMRQIAERAGIPASYYKKLTEEAPALLDENVNHWFDSKPANRLVRSLDGNVRAFMSDKYKLIDNAPVLGMLMESLDEHKGGIEFASMDVTDNRMYLKINSPRLQGDIKVNDPVQMGIVISNSEVGLGALDIRAMIYRLVCTNGMIAGRDMGEGVRRTHLGARHIPGVVFNQDTNRALGQAMALQVRDTVRQLLSPETFEKHLLAFRETTEHKVEGDPTKAVEQLGKVVGYTKEEGSGIMRHLIEGGDLSQYGLLNAVTRFAQDVDSYDRSTELEQMGGKILSLSPRDWKQVAEAA